MDERLVVTLYTLSIDEVTLVSVNFDNTFSVQSITYHFPPQFRPFR
jgi:hypothetical protein